MFLHFCTKLAPHMELCCLVEMHDLIGYWMLGTLYSRLVDIISEIVCNIFTLFQARGFLVS